MLSDDAFEGVEMAVGSEEDWLRLALEQHKTLQRSALAVDISLTQERLVEAERYPQVVLVAEDHLDGPITIEVPPINKNLNYWFVGIGVRYNLASLYKTKRKVQQAKRATAEAQTQLTVAQQTIGDDVHAAYVDLGTARSELQTRRKAVQLATENYEVVGKRYKNGLALITDMTDAANVKTGGGVGPGQRAHQRGLLLLSVEICLPMLVGNVLCSAKKILLAVFSKASMS